MFPGGGGGRGEESWVFNLDRMQYQMSIFLREKSGRIYLFLRILKDIRTYRQTDIEAYKKTNSENHTDRQTDRYKYRRPRQRRRQAERYWT